jgi:hypothetical protein
MKLESFWTDTASSFEGAPTPCRSGSTWPWWAAASPGFPPRAHWRVAALEGGKVASEASRRNGGHTFCEG